MGDFRRDFDFIFYSKKDLAKLTKLEYIKKRLDFVERHYCFDYFEKNGLNLVRYFHKVSSLYEKSFLLEDFEHLQETVNQVKKITQPILKNKSDLFDALTTHYRKLKNKHPSLYSLRFSFGFSREMKVGHIGGDSLLIRNNCISLGSWMRKFLNNSRQRALLQRVVGYFWVVMKEPDGTPYIHINLYMDNDRFNANVAIDVKDLWISVTNKSGCVLPLNISKRYGNAEIYNDKVRTMFSRTLVVDKSKIIDLICDDFNLMGRSIVKYKAEASDEKNFERYLYLVSQESYPVYTLNTSLQSTGKNKFNEPTRVSINDMPMASKKIRSYAVSQKFK